VTEEKPRRILIVEDEEAVRRSLVRLLRNRGYAVTACADGADALEVLRSERFSAVVSDIRMPGVSGTELLRRIRAQAPDLPVIFITGEPNLDTAIEAVSLGAFQYIIKPFASDELIGSLERSVRLTRMNGLRRLADSAGTISDPTEALAERFAHAESLLWLTYQAIVGRGEAAATRGYEVLLRTGDPVLRDPEHLFAAAERLGRRPSLDRFVQDGAAHAVANVLPEQLMFVNLLPLSLLDEGLLDPTRPLLARADRVVLEVTERSSLEGIPALRARVDALRERGYRIAIDDIGAGYAGLSSFVALQPEFVKLDMSLVRDVDTAPLKRRLIDSLISVSHDLGVEVIAEGVESEAEYETLHELGCDLFQGYHIAKPARALPGGAEAATSPTPG
jgi:EAL domain-containing protein (putative c-di-GMP-specific phosphodiesterase class I)/CheY-like chemotaxis protein